MLKKAPHYKSKVRFHQVLKWLKHTTPRTKRLQRKEWMALKDLEYIEDKIAKLTAFLDYMKKHMKPDKDWLKWIKERRIEIEAADATLNEVNSAEGDNRKPTWVVEKRMDLQAHKVGQEAKKIYYPKGSPFAI